tara:strand:+ start:308 stop:451 length:144 start_codon:yes stop_codon:yes gene_type:complete
MFPQEQEIIKNIKTGAFMLLTLLLCTLVEPEVVVIGLLSLIYMKMRN